MDKAAYIAETKDFFFYRNEDEELTMELKTKKGRFGVSEMVENALHEAIEKDELVKISPEFAYDYLEIKKEIEKYHG